jgi:hypothetical protein
MRLPLSERHAIALDQAVEFLTARFAPTAIVASGSVVRGTGHDTSDLDIVAIHEATWRQRVQRAFNGVACEMFVNPAFHIPRQMEKDARAGRPVMAHMLATGIIVHDPDGIAAALQREAIANLDAGPHVEADALDFRRYGVATQFEDAGDLVDADPDRSRALLIEALVAAVKWWSLANGRWLPRDKEVFDDLDRRDPGLGAAVRAVIREPVVARQVQLANAPIRALIGVTGFYEWESTPEEMAP